MIFRFLFSDLMLNHNFDATVFLGNAIFFQKNFNSHPYNTCRLVSYIFHLKFDEENFSKFFKICPLLVAKKSTVGGGEGARAPPGF